MTFLHISDIHFLNSYPKVEAGYNSIFKKMINPIVKLERCLNKISLDKIDFIIITGDLVEDGIADDYSVLKKKLDCLFEKTPYFITLGNHDNKKEFYKGWFSKENEEKPYNTINEIDNIRIIGFDNSQYNNNNGIISSDQYQWLRETLKNESNTKDTILFLHHHLLKNQFNTPSVDVEEEFENIITSSSIIGIFTGHTHHTYNGRFANRPYFTCGSVSFIGYDENHGEVRFEESAACNLYTYDQGKFEVETIDGLDKKKILAHVNFKE